MKEVYLNMAEKFSKFFLKTSEVDESLINLDKRNLKKLMNFVEDYKNQKKKILILYGSSGVGKTFIASYIAKKLDYELYELNPSNQLNKKNIAAGLKQAATQMSLFNKNKIILIDELDNFSSRYDRGYLSEITKIAKESNFPIIVTLNDLYNQKISSLRSKATKIEIKNASEDFMRKIAHKTMEKNKFKVSEELLDSLIIKADGDLRALLLDLFIFSHFPLEEIDSDKIKDFVGLARREKDHSIYDSIKTIFLPNKKEFYEINSLNEDWNNLILWISENAFYVEKVVDNPIFWNMFEQISKSDVFLRRIRYNQHWRFLVYVSFFLTKGINTSLYDYDPKTITRHIKERFYKEIEIEKQEYNAYSGKTEFPRFLIQMSRTMRSRALMKSIINKIFDVTHQSKNRIKENFGFYKHMILKDESLKKSLEIDDLELKYLKT